MRRLTRVVLAVVPMLLIAVAGAAQSQTSEEMLRLVEKVAGDPSVVAARVADVSEGFIVWDDTGSEWTREGDKFNFRHFPNRFFHSRESGAATARHPVARKKCTVWQRWLALVMKLPSSSQWSDS